jgi:hypothetical protein
MDIRSAIEVESPVTFGTPSRPVRRNVNFKPRIDSTGGRPLGTSTNPRERMAPPVRAVLGLPSVLVEDAGRDFFALPTGDHCDRPPTERCSERGRGFRDDDVLSLCSALIVVTRIGRSV